MSVESANAHSHVRTIATIWLMKKMTSMFSFGPAIVLSLTPGSDEERVRLKFILCSVDWMGLGRSSGMSRASSVLLKSANEGTVSRKETRNLAVDDVTFVCASQYAIYFISWLLYIFTPYCLRIELVSYRCSL